MERKKDIRRQILTLRREQGAVQWKRNTDRITELIVSHTWFKEAGLIYAYMDFRGEVGTRKLIMEAWERGKRVCVPRVSGNVMDFFVISSFSELEPGAFGVLEPDGKGVKISGEAGLMIMPGAAFDREKSRIGYGGGYYDRYLVGHPDIHTLAAAFSFQIVDKIDSEETDVKPEMIVTEKGIF